MRERPYKYIPGDPWLICDECGLKYRRSEMQKRWDGFMVCKKDYEPRHPQEFVRGMKDKISFPDSRPDYDSQTGSNLLSAPNYTDASVTANSNGYYTLDGSQSSAVEISWRISGTTGATYRTILVVSSYSGNGTANVSLQKDLISNGVFTANTDGWTGINTDLSVVSGKLRATLTADYVGVAHQEIETVSGSDYLLDFTAYNGDSDIYSAVVRVRKDHPELGQSLYTYSGAVSDASIRGASFTAGSTSTFICLRNTASTTGLYTEWDNVSVRDNSAGSLFESDISWNGKYIVEESLRFDSGFLVFTASEDFIGTVKPEFFLVS